MDADKDIKRFSKFISLVLRHKPEIIGLLLDKNGWANVQELIEKMNQHGTQLSADILEQVVLTNSKQRFSFSDDKLRIRANQGHSIAVDLELPPRVPPDELYHGTAEKFLASILSKGLLRGERQHVHLSADFSTALEVGSRHGKPIIFRIDTASMSRDGLKFYLSANNVWLTDNVPSNYLWLLTAKGG